MSIETNYYSLHHGDVQGMVSNSEPCSLLYNQDAVHPADLQVPSLQHQETSLLSFIPFFSSMLEPDTALLLLTDTTAKGPS